MTEPNRRAGFHELADARRVAENDLGPETASSYAYTFENFFHPFVGQLIEKLNTSSGVAGLLDPAFLGSLDKQFFADFYTPAAGTTVNSGHLEIDLSVGGPYANYNWELFFHVPLTIAVHLSNNQRFAEAQQWFHHIFDPMNNDTTVAPPARYWKFLRFRQATDVQNIDDLVRLLSIPGSTADEVLSGYEAIKDAPFHPHRVAATRTIAYQYQVVMKYLDNLIAWGDSLFREDTAESVAEATQRYVLAANILGDRPQRTPRRGTRAAKTFAQLRKKLGEIGDALVELEAQFPFNLTLGSSGGSGLPGAGIGRTLYFCVPRNDRLLAYWDRVDDRLFKVRNCLNLDGVERQLALFDPAIEPGLLVKAAAAGIDTSVAAAEQLQPTGPLRGTFLLQQAIELTGEVRALGSGLLSAIEKADAEDLALLRQGHELKVQQLAQEVRFLQWRQAQSVTDALLRTREVALERLRFYRRLLGLASTEPDTFVIARPPTPDAQPLLTEDSFDEVYAAIVGRYDVAVPVQGYPPLKLVGEQSPSSSSGASGTGRLNLTTNEDQELNKHLPAARDLHLASSVVDTVASVLAFIPDLDIDLHFWGLGLHSEVFGGAKLSDAGKIAAGIIRTIASWEQDQAGMAARTAGYERRADEWTMQHNLAARELAQLGRQLLSSIIAEQAAHREYLNVKQVQDQVREVTRFLQAKFTNRELYGWLQGELTRLYYDYYRFALDVARKAEQALNRELMPEKPSQYVKAQYGDGGRRGLLAAETLMLDLRRLDLAHRENRSREYELVKHVSVAELDPLALLQLRATGSCQLAIPEALFDVDCPGHYLRRLRRVSVSIPAVAGPYTSLNCTLSLLRSSVRTTAGGGQYARQDGQDDRFTDYAGTIQSIVTSDGRDDSGLFDPTARDERYLPFEGAGAISSWRLSLPSEFRQFDYDTIPDVILHLRYTAREGGAALRDAAVRRVNELVSAAQAAGSARMFSIRREFAAEWAGFTATAPGGRAELTAPLREEHYPFWSRGRARQVRGIELLAVAAPSTESVRVFAGPEPSAGVDVLRRDPAFGGLLRGELTNIPLPQAIGDLSLFFDDTSLQDLWLILTWGG
ncbi:Tc toxin subunit A-related protein [Amycolatopsis pithecellobii]|uniref:Toxin n=1 Tax=Amycolatopsis pithecellobii TaxID=664692 RepID=A0A6N7YTH8_9PSEU|nr:toxin [Amycolatopsis pithecellobii]MTD55248.1 toxin [Amycolatopsis pithecellobii]